MDVFPLRQMVARFIQVCATLFLLEFWMQFK